MRPHTRTRLVIVAVLPFLLLAVVLFLAKRVRQDERDDMVRLAAAAAPQGGSPECGKLLAGLPERLGPFARAKLADPAPAGAAAWRGERGEVLELRCGIPRPGELQRDAAYQEVSGVKWLRVGEQDARAEQSWVAVDRPVYVLISYDPGIGTTAPVQGLSDVLAATLTAKEPDYSAGS